MPLKTRFPPFPFVSSWLPYFFWYVPTPLQISIFFFEASQSNPPHSWTHPPWSYRMVKSLIYFDFSRTSCFHPLRLRTRDPSRLVLSLHCCSPLTLFLLTFPFLMIRSWSGFPRAELSTFCIPTFFPDPGFCLRNSPPQVVTFGVGSFFVLGFPLNSCSSASSVIFFRSFDTWIKTFPAPLFVLYETLRFRGFTSPNSYGLASMRIYTFFFPHLYPCPIWIFCVNVLKSGAQFPVAFSPFLRCLRAFSSAWNDVGEA